MIFFDNHDQFETEILMLCFCTMWTVTLGDEFTLYNYLFDKTRYSPSVRPIMDASHTVEVKVKLELSHIESIDQGNQILHSSAFMVAVSKARPLYSSASKHSSAFIQLNLHGGSEYSSIFI